MNLQPGYRFFGFPDLRFDRPCRSGFFLQFQFGQRNCRLFRFDLQLFTSIPAFRKYRFRGGQSGSGQKSCHTFVICEDSGILSACSCPDIDILGFHLSIFRLRTLLRSAATFSLFRVLALSLWSTAAFSLLRVRPLSLLPSLRIVLRLIRLLPFAPARPEDQLVNREFLNLLVVPVLEHNLGLLAENIKFYHLSGPAVRGAGLLAHLGHLRVQVFVSVFLILKAAHQSSAGSGDLGRIERKILFLCHLDRNRREVAQVGGAAEFSAADPHTAQHLRLIAYADLPQLDPHAEYRSQVFHQIPEIDSPVRGKIKKDLASVKGILRIHQLHVKVMLSHLFPADVQSLFFFCPVFLNLLRIFLRRDPDHLAQRLRHHIVRDISDSSGHRAVFRSAGSLHDDMIAHDRLQITRIKIVDLSRAAEAHSNNFNHISVFSTSFQTPSRSLSCLPS